MSSPRVAPTRVILVNCIGIGIGGGDGGDADPGPLSWEGKTHCFTKRQVPCLPLPVGSDSRPFLFVPQSSSRVPSWRFSTRRSWPSPCID